MSGVQWNLLNTNAPAEIAAGITGGFQQGMAQGQKMQMNALAMQQAQQEMEGQMAMRNALMQSGGDMNKAAQAVMPYDPKLAMEMQSKQSGLQTANLEREIKLHTIRQNSAEMVANAPQGAVLQTALELAEKNAQLVGANPEQLMQAKQRLQEVFNTQGEDGLRKEALFQALGAKDRLSKIQIVDAGDRKIFAETNQYAPGYKGKDIPIEMSEQEKRQLAVNEGNLRVAEQNLQAKQAGMGGDVSSLAQSIADYNTPPPSAWAMAKPQGQALMQEVLALNPAYDATTYEAKKDASKKFGAGQLGNQMRSFQTANEHLTQLDGLITALDNNDVQAVNAAANKVSKWFGGTAPTNFESVKGVVSKEIIKAIVQNGGGVEERQEFMELMADAKSTAQLQGIVQQFKYLMEAQYENLIAQRQATGLSDSTMPNYGKESEASVIQPAPLTTPGSGPPPGWTLMQDAAGNKAYVSPDGKQFQEVQ